MDIEGLYDYMIRLYESIQNLVIFGGLFQTLMFNPGMMIPHLRSEGVEINRLKPPGR